jgi:hypothetical protein
MLARFAVRTALALRLLGAGLVASTASGCVVEDELKDGLREMRSELASSSLSVAPDGSGRLAFKFQYGIALVDEAGIEPFPWVFRLVDPDRTVLAERAQEMRKAQPEKTRVLVTGERERTLDVPAGALVEGRTYVLWVTVTYRDETLHEVLYPVVAGGEAAGADAFVSPALDAGPPDAGVLVLAP